MLVVVREKWWMWVLRGIFSVLLGAVLLLWPIHTVGLVIVFLGFFLLFDGLVSGFVAFAQRRRASRWGWYLLEGLLGAAIGLLAILHPQWLLLTALIIIAIWAIGSGMLRIVTGVALRKEVTQVWMILLSGILSVCIGLLILFLPREALIALLWIISVILLFNGGILVALGLQLKRQYGDYIAI